MLNIPATHIASGHAGEVQLTMTDNDGGEWFYFEDHTRPTVAGWHPSSALIVPGVNAEG